MLRVKQLFPLYFFRPTSFLQKSSCTVSSEKNILNSSVEWSGVMLRKLKVYFPKRVLFIINTVIRCAHDNVRTCVISYSFIVKWKSLFSQTCFVYYHCAHDNIHTCVIQ